MNGSKAVFALAEMSAKAAGAYTSFVEQSLRKLGANEHTIHEFEIRSYNADQGENHVFRNGTHIATLRWKIDCGANGLPWLMAGCNATPEGTDSE